jgi:hypothetical protein
VPRVKGRPRGGVVTVTHGGFGAHRNYEVTSSTFDLVNHVGVVAFSLDITNRVILKEYTYMRLTVEWSQSIRTW